MAARDAQIVSVIGLQHSEHDMIERAQHEEQREQHPDENADEESERESGGGDDHRDPELEAAEPPVADPAFTAVVALMTGLLALGAGIFRLGFLANFISEPVLKGFIIGLALTIMIGQVPKLFGVATGDGDFFRQLGHFVAHLGDAQWRTTVVGVLSLAIVLGLRRFAPAIPASLVAVIFGIVLVHLFSLDAKGVDIVGHIDSGLPSLGPPDGVGIHDYFAAAASSVGIMLVGFAEGLGAAKTYAQREHYDIDPNRELLGLGAANLGAGLSSGMVVNGSLSKTAVNAGAGARSQISGVFVAVMTVITLLFLTGLFEDLPEATLAAVVIAALVDLVDFPALVELYRLYTRRLGQIYGAAARPDFIAAVAAMMGVLLFDTLPGLFIGIAVSLLCCCTARRDRTRRCWARCRAPDRSTPTAIGTRRTKMCRASRSCASRAVCSSPMPTPCARQCAPTRRTRPSTPSSSTRSRSRSSTSPRCACCTISPTTSRARTCSSRSHTRSVRFAT
jgi:hypothetical protein